MAPFWPREDRLNGYMSTCTICRSLYSTVTQPYCDTAVHYGRTVQVLYTAVLL